MSEKRVQNDVPIENQTKYKKSKEHNEQKRDSISIIDKQPTLIIDTLNTINVVDEKSIINKKENTDNDCYSNGELINHCVECGVDMGSSNPRQYCGKWKCDGYGYGDDSENYSEDYKEE
jgi:hypothetical protein